MMLRYRKTHWFPSCAISLQASRLLCPQAAAYQGLCSGLADARAKAKRLGRPAATPRLVNKGLSLIRQGMTFEHAAEQSGVSVSTLLRARRKRQRRLTVEKVGRWRQPRNGALSNAPNCRGSLW
jgi:CRP-like cAMP-binding protein